MPNRILGINIAVAAAAPFFCILPVCGPFAQGVAFVGSAHSGVIGEIPFRVERNRAILPLVVSKAETLNILLDTGMTWDGVYLFRKDAQRHFPGEALDSVRSEARGAVNQPML
ncbi:hypothetical protein JXA88_16670 [Candidatus Fermentibacteria bacterium]|nr:hypothetical protein [Candidatus Fermentibacteria bacterium]